MTSKKVIQPIIYLLNGAINVKPATGVLLVAPPGSGKSVLIRSIKGEGILFLDDFTASSIDTIIENYENIRMIAVSDLNKVLARDIKSSPLSILLNLTEEGYVGSARYKDVKITEPKRISFVAGITTDKFLESVDKLKATGLLSRMLLINYSYTDEERQEIMKERLRGFKLEEQDLGIRFQPDLEQKPLSQIAIKFIEDKIAPLITDLRQFTRFQALVHSIGSIYSPDKEIISQVVAFTAALVETYSGVKSGNYERFLSALKYWLKEVEPYEKAERGKTIFSSFNSVSD